MKKTYTETEIVAKAVNEFMTRPNRRKLKDILVQSSSQLATSKKPGWKVFFVFEEADSFLHNCMTFEVDLDGEVKVFENM